MESLSSETKGIALDILEDILSAIEKVEERTKDVNSIDDFLCSSSGMVLLDATCMLLIAIAESNKLERFCQYVRDNAWQRYAFDDIRKRTPLNAYISPTQEAAFKKAILALVSDGTIRQVFPSVDNLQTILLGNKSGAQTKVLTAVITHVRPRFLKLNGNYPPPERREFFHRLHQVFCVSPSDERSFDRAVCRAILQIKGQE